MMLNRGRGLLLSHELSGLSERTEEQPVCPWGPAPPKHQAAQPGSGRVVETRRALLWPDRLGSLFREDLMLQTMGSRT